MSAQWILVQIIVWYSVYCYGFPEIKNEGSTLNSFAPVSALTQEKIKTIGERNFPILTKLAQDLNESVANIDFNATDVFEGRMRKRKYKRQEIMMLTKMLMGLKIALLGVVLPMAVLAAKVLSWKAVTLSLLAFMLAKIVFVKNLLMGKSSSPVVPSPSPAPIVIQAPSPSHETIWKRHSPRIHLQPEVHVHQGDDHHQPNPSWSYADEGRSSQDLAYKAWLPKPT